MRALPFARADQEALASDFVSGFAVDAAPVYRPVTALRSTRTRTPSCSCSVSSVSFMPDLADHPPDVTTSSPFLSSVNIFWSSFAASTVGEAR